MMSNEYRFFVPAAIKVIIGRLAPRIETAAGAPLSLIIDLNPAIPKRIATGEAFDIALTNPPYATALFEKRLADCASHRPFGRVPLAIARRADVELPVLTQATDIAALLRDAQDIVYTGAGTSGRIYLEVLEKLRLRDEVTAKSQSMSSGVPAVSVATGDVELAVAPLTTVLATPGVVPAAIFPEELEAHIDMSVFLSSKPRIGAEFVLDFLTAVDLDTELADAGIMRFELA